MTLAIRSVRMRRGDDQFWRGESYALPRRIEHLRGRGRSGKPPTAPERADRWDESGCGRCWAVAEAGLVRVGGARPSWREPQGPDTMRIILCYRKMRLLKVQVQLVTSAPPGASDT